MKRLLALLIMVSTIFCTPVMAEDGIRYVSTQTLNVRNEANTDSEIVGTLSLNQTVIPLSDPDVNGWVEIEYNGQQAFVQSAYLSYEYVENKKSYTQDDLYILAHVLSGECQGYPDEEQRYVGSVVLNRVASKNFPNNIHDVVFQKGQYACTWDGNYNRTPTERNWANAQWLLENGSVLPSNVVYQSQSKLGKVYTKTKYHYYCY